MSAMPLSRLLGAVARQESIPDPLVTGLSLNSAEIRAGDLFLALPGTRQHGLAHLPEAVARGACAVAWEPAPGIAPPDSEIPAIAVPRLREQAGPLAARFYGDPSRRMPVVGVTGTNGKTSCTWLLAHAVNLGGGDAGVIGTLGCGRVESLQPGERTTPDAITLQRLLKEMAEQDLDLVAMEVSSHALDQHRVSGTHFLLAVFTNLSRDHLDYHGDMTAYGRAKRKLFHAPGLQVAVINQDDPFGRELSGSLPPGVSCIRYATDSGKADVRLGGLEIRPGGLSFELSTPAGSARVNSRLLGRFNAGNLLAVASVLHALGWMVQLPGPRRGLKGTRPGADEIADLLSRLPTVPGRMERLPAKKGRPMVVVDYAHTPNALSLALEALREHAKGRVICVFGCGGERDRGKRPLMGRIAERLAGRVIVTDDNPRAEDGDTIVREILDGMTMPGAAMVERDRARAIRAAISEAGPEDIVLLAGKGHETYQEIVGERQPFCDREVALAVLAEDSA